MKKFLLLASIAICSTGHLISMEQQTESLNFLVDQYYTIEGCLASNMEFAIPESEFMGKNLVNVIELQGDGNNDVQEAFEMAYDERQSQTVQYVFQNKGYVAEITPLFDSTQEEERVSYFVKVTQSTNP